MSTDFLSKVSELTAERDMSLVWHILLCYVVIIPTAIWLYQYAQKRQHSNDKKKS